MTTGEGSTAKVLPQVETAGNLSAMYFPSELGEPYYAIEEDGRVQLVDERTLEDAKMRATPSGGLDTTPLQAREAILPILGAWDPQAEVRIVRRFDRDWNSDRTVLLVVLTAPPETSAVSAFIRRVVREVPPDLMADLHLDFTMRDADHPA